jgi:hypothetical protein
MNARGEATGRWLGLLLLGALVPSALPARAHPGIGIVMDGSGSVFYTDLYHVWKIAPDGRKTIAVRSVHTHELCLDSAENLYGEHLWYEGDATKKWGHRVWRLGPDGTLAEVIPAREGFRTDYSFVRDGARNMYWVEGTPARIRKRTPEGAVSTLAECRDCRDVRWMAATKDGTVLFIESGDLRAVAPAGEVRTLAHLGRRIWTQPQVSEQHALMGLWTDSAGFVYVARYGSREVMRVAADGAVRVVATSTFPWSPTGGLVAPNGDLWLLEYSLTNAARVRRIARDGRITVY